MHKTIMFSRKPDEKFTIPGIIDIIDLLTPETAQLYATLSGASRQ